MKYRHKPLEVTAIQYNGENEEKIEVLFGIRLVENTDDFIGSYIIRDHKNNTIILSKKEFEKRYEPVEEPNYPEFPKSSVLGLKTSTIVCETCHDMVQYVLYKSPKVMICPNCDMPFERPEPDSECEIKVKPFEGI